MNYCQFRGAAAFSSNLPDVACFFFKWTMTAATTFTINRSQELLAGTAGIVRTGVGVYDIFPTNPPGFELVEWWFDSIEVARSNTSAGSGNTSIANNLVASNKITVTFRNNATQAATDFATNDIVYGFIGIQVTKF